MRMMYLARYPICADPHGDHAKEGRCEIASEVHHKVSRLKRPDLAYDEDNLEALCKSCHSRETKGNHARTSTDTPTTPRELAEEQAKTRAAARDPGARAPVLA